MCIFEQFGPFTLSLSARVSDFFSEQFDSVQEHFDIYEDDSEVGRTAFIFILLLLNMKQFILQKKSEHIVPHVQEAIEEPSDVDESHGPHTSERLAVVPAAHEAIHLEVPLVIEVRSTLCIPSSTDGSPSMPLSNFAILSSLATTEATCPSPPYPPSKLSTPRPQALVEIDAANVMPVVTLIQANFALSF